jgi:hypothetical protein
LLQQPAQPVAALQLQCPPEHRVPGEQVVPQLPQLPLSLVVSTHAFVALQ